MVFTLRLSRDDISLLLFNGNGNSGSFNGNSGSFNGNANCGNGFGNGFSSDGNGNGKSGGPPAWCQALKDLNGKLGLPPGLIPDFTVK